MCDSACACAQCYVPSLADSTCLLRTGDACSGFGLETQFEDPVACCNKLITTFMGLKLSTLAVGGCVAGRWLSLSGALAVGCDAWQYQ